MGCTAASRDRFGATKGAEADTARTRALPVDEALAIARQIADMFRPSPCSWDGPARHSAAWTRHSAAWKRSGCPEL
jgi:hypothetical protein